MDRDNLSGLIKKNRRKINILRHHNVLRNGFKFRPAVFPQFPVVQLVPDRMPGITLKFLSEKSLPDFIPLQSAE